MGRHGEPASTPSHSERSARAIEVASPEQVRKKWDALLSVINNVSVEPAAGSAAAQPLQAARELLSDSLARESSLSPGASHISKKDWDARHHLLYSTINHKMQKNIRSYFDRPREIDSYGTRHDPPLRAMWQLDTPTEPTEAGPTSPMSSSKAMARSASVPEGRMSNREAHWDGRHSVMFNKDNHHYHPNFRDYFERPRHLLV